MRIKSIKVENFMGFHSEMFVFDEKNTLVSGKNGTGKSTIVNAWMWLMFGCDQELRDNPVVRREVDGEPVNDMDVIVEAVVNHDGIDMTFRKTQKRTFNKDGSSYKDDNKYSVNEVPVTLKAYNEKIGIDIETLRESTSLKAFTSLKSKEMREMIFGMIENVTDLQVAEKSENEVIASRLKAGYSTEEIKAMANATKSRCNKEIPQLDGMIMEAERNASIEIDTTGLPERIEEIKAEINSIGKAISENSENEKKISNDLMNLQFEKTESVKAEQQKISKEKSSLMKDYERLLLAYQELFEKERGLKSYANTISEKCNSYLAEIREMRGELEKMNNFNVDYSNLEKVENQEFDESSTTCPVCKRKFAKSKITDMMNSFEKKKQREINRQREIIKAQEEKVEVKKAEISSLLNRKCAEVEEMKTERARVVEQISAMANDLLVAKDDYLTARNKAEAMDVIHPDMSENFDYQILLKKIAAKENALNELRSADVSDLLAKRYGLQEELKGIEIKLKEADRTEYKIRLEELVSNKKNLVQEKANCEMILDALDELDKAKNEYLTDAINAKFNLVSWKMFEYAKNGNYKSVCVPMVDGKEILAIKCNKALRLRGLIDICESIQRHHGIEVPIFIDDFESFDSENARKVIESCKSQIICMMVNNEKLKVEVAED